MKGEDFRYEEELSGGLSTLLWPAKKEDKETRLFYRRISHATHGNYGDSKKIGIFNQILKIIFGRGSTIPINSSVKKYIQ